MKLTGAVKPPFIERRDAGLPAIQRTKERRFD
jgi:hypothetical protein